MVGAPVLSALAAIRSGAGLVRLAVAKSQQAVAAKKAPLEVMTEALPEDRAGRITFSTLATIKKSLKSFRPNVIAVGPGLGRSAGARALVKYLLWSSDIPVVLDADGLNALSTLPVRRFSKPVILTPHEGELSRILDRPGSAIKKDRIGSAVAAARRYGCVCLLKGPGTLVTDGSTVYKNTTGSPAMAVGGMGDFLTGLIASLWGQMGASPSTAIQAAAFGAYWHGLSADRAVRKFPAGTLLASDLANFLPEALKKLIQGGSL